MRKRPLKTSSGELSAEKMNEIVKALNEHERKLRDDPKFAERIDRELRIANLKVGMYLDRIERSGGCRFVLCRPLFHRHFR
ncbi:hypothetical protein HYV44_01725 [Candidatus Microgenomates bacterium]|nr:hypothetical protein [Candidatus Microgenomates bacterium]